MVSPFLFERTRSRSHSTSLCFENFTDSIISLYFKSNSNFNQLNCVFHNDEAEPFFCCWVFFFLFSTNLNEQQTSKMGKVKIQFRNLSCFTFVVLVYHKRNKAFATRTKADSNTSANVSALSKDGGVSAGGARALSDEREFIVLSSEGVWKKIVGARDCFVLTLDSAEFDISFYEYTSAFWAGTQWLCSAESSLLSTDVLLANATFTGSTSLPTSPTLLAMIGHGPRSRDLKFRDTSLRFSFDGGEVSLLACRDGPLMHIKFGIAFSADRVHQRCNNGIFLWVQASATQMITPKEYELKRSVHGIALQRKLPPPGKRIAWKYNIKKDDSLPENDDNADEGALQGDDAVESYVSMSDVVVVPFDAGSIAIEMAWKVVVRTHIRKGEKALAQYAETVVFGELDKDAHASGGDNDGSGHDGGRIKEKRARAGSLTGAVGVALLTVGPQAVGKSAVLRACAHVAAEKDFVDVAVGEKRAENATTLDLDVHIMRRGLDYVAVDDSSSAAARFGALRRKVYQCRELVFVDTAGRNLTLSSETKQLLQALVDGLPDGTALYGDSWAQYAAQYKQIRGTDPERKPHWSDPDIVMTERNGVSSVILAVPAEAIIMAATEADTMAPPASATAATGAGDDASAVVRPWQWKYWNSFFSTVPSTSTNAVAVPGVTDDTIKQPVAGKWLGEVRMLYSHLFGMRKVGEPIILVTRLDYVTRTFRVDEDRARHLIVAALTQPIDGEVTPKGNYIFSIGFTNEAIALSESAPSQFRATYYTESSLNILAAILEHLIDRGLNMQSTGKGSPTKKGIENDNK